MTSKLDVAASDVGLMALKESTKDFVVEDGLLKLMWCKTMNFVVTKDKISYAPAKAKKIENTDSTRSSSNGQLEVPRGEL